MVGSSVNQCKWVSLGHSLTMPAISDDKLLIFYPSPQRRSRLPAVWHPLLLVHPLFNPWIVSSLENAAQWTLHGIWINGAAESANKQGQGGLGLGGAYNGGGWCSISLQYYCLFVVRRLAFGLGITKSLLFCAALFWWLLFFHMRWQIFSDCFLDELQFIAWICSKGIMIFCSD